MNEIANTKTRKRCAVYCRVSTDERLDQEFNSIDAQKEAGHAYIASQRTEGWISVADDYDDPGFSGGNTDRPALKRLLADLEHGQIDIVVVYKIDRLTRSLADFSKMVEVFERNEVSFVSVTQQFNTTTPMGRLMLNVLLSFAQFEREVTGERIRDKIAAAKRKGMWMGGVPSIGYDVVNRQLVINEAEAAVVRRIFEEMLTIGSPTQIAARLTAEGITTKAWTTQEGQTRSGTRIDKKYLHKLLRNRIYLGSCRTRETGTPERIRRSSTGNCGTRFTRCWPRAAMPGQWKPRSGHVLTPCCVACYMPPRANACTRPTRTRRDTSITITCPSPKAASARRARATSACPHRRLRQRWSPKSARC